MGTRISGTVLNICVGKCSHIAIVNDENKFTAQTTVKAEDTGNHITWTCKPFLRAPNLLLVRLKTDPHALKKGFGDPGTGTLTITINDPMTVFVVLPTAVEYINDDET